MTVPPEVEDLLRRAGALPTPVVRQTKAIAVAVVCGPGSAAVLGSVSKF